ncbi:hypothetical protein ACFOOK_28315 [Micromonospora krabiensis]|uniref:Uncharacterized protein n=1 Tax=Micromonospora krabiensis TaxID=307121 RepID=A0A1C3N4N7_9ACTN|nr:hypothetical protein [Micromonospora krabiensis]SBV27525.1 hypothetical protein GA0070620_3049 [Micromonospora krabiensis]
MKPTTYRVEEIHTPSGRRHPVIQTTDRQEADAAFAAELDLHRANYTQDGGSRLVMRTVTR